MSRKKETPKPLFDLKFEFVASLDRVCAQAIMLMQAVDTVLQHSELSSGVKEILTERSKAMHDALMTED